MNAASEVMSISAVKPKRESGSSRMKRKRGGENVGWKRITASFDDAVRQFGANPEIGSPVTRWVYFKHLTVTQGMAARRYADVMRKFDRYHVGTKSRTARAQGYEPSAGGEDQELERHHVEGTTSDYEREARKAKKHYTKLHKVIAPFRGAKEMLDNLCLLETEPPAEHRASCAAVLTLIAKAFGISRPLSAGEVRAEWETAA